jgi:cytochrome c oxidase cbb3-type subunit 2
VATPGGAPTRPRTRLQNPFTTDDLTAVAAGAAIWGGHCATCHGLRGEGDGKTTPPGLGPRMFAQVTAAPGLVEVYRFEIVQHGVVRDRSPVMPAFAGKLSDEDIWRVVTFIGTLTPPAAPPEGEAFDARGLVRAEQPRPVADKALLHHGLRVYRRLCASCHGLTGHGDGPAREYLERSPGDLSRGPYKLRSTPLGQLPLDEDLFDTITRGMGPAGMPGFQRLGERDRWAVVEHVKSLNQRFAREARAPITIPPPPAATAQAIERGRQAYRKAGCAECHGATGRGDGPRSAQLTDWRGHLLRPADLSSAQLIGGSEPVRIYRTLMAGLDGTPMPQGDKFFTAEEAWDVVEFIRALRLLGRAPAPSGR